MLAHALLTPGRPVLLFGAAYVLLSLPLEGSECLPAPEDRCASQVSFYAKKLVVFGCALRSAGGSRLDLPYSRGNSQVGDREIFGLTGAVTHNAGITILAREINCVERLGQSADLVGLDQHRVSNTTFDTSLDSFGISDEQIIANQLNTRSELIGQHFPSVPIIFGEPVFDADNRIFVDQPHIVVDHLFSRKSAILGPERVFSAVVEFSRRRIEGKCDLISGLETS